MEVGFEAGVGGEGSAFDGVGFDEHPGAVADGGDGLVVLHEATDEHDGVLVLAQGVWVFDTAGNDEGVEVAVVDFGDEFVDVEALPFLAFGD